MDKLYIDYKYNFSVASTGDYMHIGAIYKGVVDIHGEKFLKVISLDTLQERLLNPKYIWGISYINLLKGNYDEEDILVANDEEDDGHAIN